MCKEFTPPSNHTKLGAALTIKNKCTMYLMKKITYFLDIIDLMFTLLAYVKSLPHHQSYKAHRACNRAMSRLFSIFPALHFSINLLRPSTEQPTILNDDTNCFGFWQNLSTLFWKRVELLDAASMAWCDEKDRLFIWFQIGDYMIGGYFLIPINSCG